MVVNCVARVDVIQKHFSFDIYMAYYVLMLNGEVIIEGTVREMLVFNYMTCFSGLFDINSVQTSVYPQSFK